MLNQGSADTYLLKISILLPVRIRTLVWLKRDLIGRATMVIRKFINYRGMTNLLGGGQALELIFLHYSSSAPMWSGHFLRLPPILLLRYPEMQGTAGINTD